MTTAMTALLVDAPTLQDALVPRVEALLERIEAPAVSLRFDDWWAGLAPGLVLRSDADTGPSPTTIVAVDALRSVASPTAPLADDGRLLFVEAVEGPSVPHFDVSGFLWRSGLSVIDVVRPVIAAPDGPWEFAIGIARHTPVRVMPDESES